MRHIRFVTVAVALAVVLLAGCVRHGSIRQEASGFESAECLEDFSDSGHRVDCGWMQMPESREAPSGRQVRFPVVIVRARSAAKADPVFYLHGGPGGGVIDGLAQRLRDGELPLTADRDWIFFDQRGTGLSRPRLDCGRLELSDLGLSSDLAVDDAIDCGRSLSSEGVDLAQYHSSVVVDDLLALRRALGVGRFNLYGVSYGGRVVLETMRRAPPGLRAVVLDSPWAPEANWTQPLPGLVADQLRDVLALCDDDPDCHAEHPALAERLHQWLSVWLNQPPTRRGHRYAAEEVVAYVLDALYDDDATQALPDSLEVLMNGDFDDLDRFLEAQSDYVEGQFFSTLCREELPFEDAGVVDQDTSSPGNDDDPVRIAATRAVRRLFAACSGFAVGAKDASDNLPVISATPTLLLAAQIDAGCPAVEVLSAASWLRRGQAFTLPNTTHAPAERSPCARRMLADFLDRPRRAVDARCVSIERPRFPFRLRRG